VTLALIDYQAGNLASVVKALTFVGARVRIAAAATDLAGADGIVVPGVGHFGSTAHIAEALRLEIAAQAARGVPLLGICLGMQWLFESSDEAPGVRGLGVFDGRITRLSGMEKIPHVGWNTIESTGRRSRLLNGFNDAGPTPVAYFTHSYAAPTGAETVATTSYGTTFASIVERGNVFGTQFHPEKSGRAGLDLLAAYIGVVREATVSC
jgi:glutamine amidotransferase